MVALPVWVGCHAQHADKRRCSHLGGGTEVEGGGGLGLHEASGSAPEYWACNH